MTALAILARQAGFPVTGSDTEGYFITDEPLKKAGIRVFSTFDEQHVKSAQLVIATGAHGGFGNPEVVAAKANGIAVWSQGEAVGKFMDGTLLTKEPFFGISVAGTHGKTTTTSMIATLFTKLMLDPSYVIGTSHIASLPGPGHFGKGKYFIAEADEYVTEPNLDKSAKMLWQHPQIAVVTSVEFDHPDVYENISSVIDAFTQFVGNLPSSGLLVACGDDENVRSILPRVSCEVKTYGYSPRNDFVITRVFISSHQTFFWVKGMGTNLGEFHINVPGEHNALNSLATTIVGLEVGQDIEHIKKALLHYAGAKRRMEYIGQLRSGTKLYDDYAHHPTEISKTLRAFRHMYPRGRIVCIFQPHTFSRTQKLFDQFVGSFSDADDVILLDIFASAREKHTDEISSMHLGQSMKRVHKSVMYHKSLGEAASYLQDQELSDKDIIVTMGAGDVYQLHNILLKR